MKKLDKSKSYAEILGATNGERYEQNGVLFDFEGNEIVKEDKPRIGRPPKDKEI
jgi:hypothetical protein